MGLSQSGPGPKPWLVAAPAALVSALFIILLKNRSLGPFDFWTGLALTLALAAALSLAVDRGYGRRLRDDFRSGLLRKVALGLASAAALYAVFAVGRAVSLVVFPFAASGIADVYALKAATPAFRVILLLGLVIGPGEEFFWRGYFQDNVARGAGRVSGFVLAMLLYAGVHLASGNLMLVLAAAVCGLFWGWLYLRFRSPLLNIVSHTAWDLLIFAIRPL